MYSLWNPENQILFEKIHIQRKTEVARWYPSGRCSPAVDLSNTEWAGTQFRTRLRQCDICQRLRWQLLLTSYMRWRTCSRFVTAELWKTGLEEKMSDRAFLQTVTYLYMVEVGNEVHQLPEEDTSENSNSFSRGFANQWMSRRNRSLRFQFVRPRLGTSFCVPETRVVR